MTASRATYSDRIFVDSSAFFALINARERHHAAAVSIMQRLTTMRARLFTSNFICAETHALMLSKLGRGVALAFLDGLDNASTTSTTIVRVSLADEQRAKAILRNYDDKDFSFTDATSFSIMERLRLYGGFTFDSDFERYGLTALTE